MGTERVDVLSDELDQWVADRAAAEDLTREEFLHRLVDAHRTLEERGDTVAVESADTTALENAVEELETELNGVANRVAAVEDDLDEKITDVRQRVIQVKRETDAKASADHDHPEIERRLDAGFENYESILEYLTETADEHDSKLDRLGAAIVDARSRIAALERRMETREAVADLRAEANRHGVRAAACGSCDEAVQLGLLDEPSCPHCGASFDGIEAKRFFFGTDRLTVGNPPALEAGDESGRATDETDSDETADDRGSDNGFEFGSKLVTKKPSHGDNEVSKP